MSHQKIFKTAAILLILVLVVIILVFAKPFLVPVVIAALLAVLLLPVAKWLESKGFNQIVSITLSLFLLLGFIFLLSGLVAWQIADVSEKSDEIKTQLSEKYEQAQEFIIDKLGISKETQKRINSQQESSAPGKINSMVMSILSGLGGILTDMILVFVYIFMFILFRGYFKRFILRLVPPADEANTREVIKKAQKVAQKYLSGLSLMIVILWIMYGIGFSIAGVENAVFFAVICGLLEIVPFVGNLLGTGLTLVMTMVQGGDTNTILAIIFTYGFIQFVQTYIIEPLVVGAEVNINPLFTIMGLVAGELVWGIPGMVLAIPVMGITKIVFDHVEQLQPYGELMGQDKKEKNSGFKKKVTALVQKVRNRF